MELLYLVIFIPQAEGHKEVFLVHLSSKKDVLRTKSTISPPHTPKIDRIN